MGLSLLIIGCKKPKLTVGEQGVNINEPNSNLKKNI